MVASSRDGTVHYLAPDVVKAERLSATKVGAKLKVGWRWHRLEPGFGAAGGGASYSRALVSPEGRIAFVSDRATGMDDLGLLPPLAISYRLIRLTVPFAEKDAAKTLGAIWVGQKRTWACVPERVDEFRQWIAGPPEEFDLLAD